MDILANPYRLETSGIDVPPQTPFPSIAAGAAQALMARCPKAAQTPLVAHKRGAAGAGVAKLWVKDESQRMGLGSFKALGAAYVIACDHQAGRAAGRVYVTASAGNHGLSVAAGAAAFRARAVIYLAQTVPEAFAQRLRDHGAEVVRAGAVYEDSMAAAAQAACDRGWALLSDSSWPGYFERPHRLMEGYLILMAEIIAQIDQPPTHMFLQAGVGGLAGACAALAREAWGDSVQIIVVEPQAAPALMSSIHAGRAVTAAGPVSQMGRLDCKEPSLIALRGLARDADVFAAITEAEGEAGADWAAQMGLLSTPSGAAGLAALLACGTEHDRIGLTGDARVLCILSEGAEG
jgi:diaminopropionate ammonia-lyase